MNDRFTPNLNDAIEVDRQDIPAVEREIKKAPMHRRQARRRWGGRLFALGAFVSLAGGLSLGAWGNYAQQQDVLATARRARDFVPSLRVATVEPSAGIMSVTLPGTTAAFATANIYARATGYIDKRNVDIGDRVKAGDLLAELAVPELDDQIRQNEATLNQLRSTLEQEQAALVYAQQQAARYEELMQKQAGTVQNAQQYASLQQQRTAAVAAAQHNIVAQENLVKGLHQNRAYASVVAPFDGVITQRNIDIGSLVQGNDTGGTFMFEIMQQDMIRVRVYVPQDAAFGVAPGVDAIVRVPELPDHEFQGTVTRIADALQSGTRTLLTEIDLPNPDGALRPGVYCMAELKVPRRTPSFVVPADAIIFNRNGMQVAVVTDGKAAIRKVKVTRDLGTGVEVNSGLQPGDQVILNPPVNLVEGGRVGARRDAAAADI
jgi:RND family efflux transporter MFP subunit